MAQRVRIATQPWGQLVDASDNPRGNTSVSLLARDGVTPVTHYSALTGGSSASTALTSSSAGVLPRYVDEGSYLLDDGTTQWEVEAVAGATLVSAESRIATRSPAEFTGTDNAKLAAAITAAAGRPVYLDRDYAVQDLAITDQDVHLIGPGRLVHASGYRALTVEHTVGAARSVTAVATVNPRPDGISNVHEAYTQISLAQADLADVQQGDLFLIGSNDAYAAEYVTGAAALGTQTYPAAFVPVHALGLDVDGIVSGGFAEGNTIVGATSGATALLLSVATKSDSSIMLTFGKFTGTFQDNENLTVGGVVKGVVNGQPYIVAANRLLDTFTTTPKLYKAQQGRRCIIECGLVATGDVDSIVGAANRKPAIELRGVVDGDVTLDVNSAWTRAVRLSSCYATRADVRIMKLPNNAGTEGAYGYGVEFTASTEFCTATVKARNVRHATTTNTSNYASWASQPALDGGVPKFNVVHDSECWSPIGAGFDTHAGGYFHEHRACKVYGGGSLGRVTTTPQGFQNRSFGTLTVDCEAHGCTIGFDESAHNYAAPFATKVRHLRNQAINYGMYGWRWNGGSADTLTDYEAEDCLASGDGTAQNTPNLQTGFIFAGARVRVTRLRSVKFNGHPYRVTASTGSVIAVACEADYTDASTAARSFRFDAMPSGGATLLGYIVKTHSNGTTPAAAVEVTAGAVTLKTDGAKFIGGDRPFSTVSGGSLAITRALQVGIEAAASKTWDPPSCPANGSVTTTVTLAEAVAGDYCDVSFNQQNAAMILTGSVDPAGGVVNVVLFNPTAGAIDLGSGTLRALIRRRV